jgi:predicted alpha/beta superfamily hydrolase
MFKKIIVLLILGIFLKVVLFSKPKANNYISSVQYSKIVNDSFDIKIVLPKKYDKTKRYNTVYFLDANINSGNDLLNLLKEPSNKSITDSTIFIGIGHKGNFHVLRRRDFLPPILKNEVAQKNSDKNYGHADLFYSFLQTELIPLIESNYAVTSHRSIIGHSFGGLFVYYCLLKPERLFEQHFALSPSLWVDSGNIFNYEKQYSSGNKLTYKEKQFANHNSHVQLTLQEVLNYL